MKKVVGYISSDSFGNGYVSHQYQNQSIKNFLATHGHVFMLSWTEYKNCAPQVLCSLLKEHFYEGICFFSLEQLASLPEAMDLFNRLKNAGTWVGFARENIYFQGDDGFKDCVKLWWLMKNTASSSQLNLP